MSEHQGAKTTEHREIREWAEQRGGEPAQVRETGNPEDPGVLRIMFSSDDENESLEPIAWGSFFEKFEANQLAFLYQSETKQGELSQFHKFVERD